ncbi:MAG: TRAP transporter fused permease subunit [Desulfobacterales bacterium]|nr:TRAP transporter fused permease subunit [Desulfobacterales bacterium]
MRLISLLTTVGTQRVPSGWVQKIIFPYAGLIAAWVLYGAVCARIDPWEQSAVFLSAMLALVFIMISATPRSGRHNPPFYDWIFSLICVISTVYVFLRAETDILRVPPPGPLSPWDLAFGTVLFLLTLEAARRSLGLGLPLLLVALAAYIFGGHLLPASLSHGRVAYPDFLGQMVFSPNGLFGLPVRVAVTYVFLFVLFGSMLQNTRGGAFYDQLATHFSGRYSGGPAKVAVLSSAFFGTLSGSPISDVVSTGSITIPMMKRLGYSSVFAAAVETAASTGGSLLPPVMGTALFMMAELTGIAYVKIAVAGLIPALLFYYCLFMQVHYRSLKLNLLGLPPHRIPGFREIRQGCLFFFVPLLVMMVMLPMGYNPAHVALASSISVILVSCFQRDMRVTIRQMYQSLATATLRMVPITLACAAAGLVVGAMMMTDMGAKFARLLFQFSGPNVFFGLVMIAGICILLGMAMPTPSVYIIVAVLSGPFFKELGIPVMPAHLFMVYLAVLSTITPPVAFTAYAASSIAAANPLKTATAAMRLSIILILLPFTFVYDQTILLQGSIWDVFSGIATAIIGITVLAVSLEGWFRKPVTRWRRLAAAAGGLLLLISGGVTDIIGLGLSAVALGDIFLRRNQNPKAALPTRGAR